MLNALLETIGTLGILISIAANIVCRQGRPSTANGSAVGRTAGTTD